MNRFMRVLLATVLLLVATANALAASKEEIDAEGKEALAERYKQSSAFEGSKITRIDK